MSTETASPESAASGALVFDVSGDRMTSVDTSKITAYNFRNPGFLSQTQLRQFGMLHEKLVQHLSARLSTFLRMECVLKVTNFQSATFAKFCEGLGHPTHLALFQAEPLRGVGVLEIGLPLSLAMADRLLGGKGSKSPVDRVLSEIETTLLEDVIQTVLVEWTQLWESAEQNIRPQCIGHETSGRFLQTSPPDANFAVLQLEVALGEVRDQMQIGVPFSMIEPFVKRMQRNRPAMDDARPKQIQWRAPYAAIAVPLIAEWRLPELTLGEVIKIRAGDTLPLARELIQNARVRFSDVEEFSGVLGIQNGFMAIQLTERIPKD